jgi:hypothetical protein
MAIHQRITDRAYLLCILALSSIASSRPQSLSNGFMVPIFLPFCFHYLSGRMLRPEGSSFPMPWQAWYVLLLSYVVAQLLPFWQELVRDLIEIAATRISSTATYHWTKSRKGVRTNQLRTLSLNYASLRS